MHSPLWKNVVITFLCLLILAPGVIWMHTALPAQIRSHIHSSGFNGELHIFWDARPYAKGITAYNAKETPYPADNPNDILPFAYPPAFLWVGAPLARLLTPAVGWKLYMLVNLASVFLLQFILSALFFRRLKPAEGLALLCFSPLALLATTVFWSGNIHLVWYFAALLAAFPGILRKQWIWYYTVCFLAAVNQPVFLVMLLFPFLVGTRQLIPCVLDVVAVAAAYITEKLINPALYAAFQASIKQHLGASRDFGDGIFGICATLLNGHVAKAIPLSMAFQVLFSASVFFLLLHLRPRISSEQLRWWGLIIIAMALVNPRIMAYDAAIGLVPACYFLVTGMRFSLDGRQIGRWLLIGVVLSASFVAHRLLGFTLLLLAGFLSGVFGTPTEASEAHSLESHDLPELVPGKA